MIKVFDTYKFLGVCIVFFLISSVHASEQSLEASIDTRVEVNDNIFLKNTSSGTVTGIIVTPKLSGVIKEKNWEARLSTRVKNYNYSDDTIDTNDQYFDVTGRYLAERNIFSLNANYDLASNLNSTSTDFGVVGRRVNTKKQSIAPQYTRLLTERSVLMLSYTYSDVSFLEAESTGFVDYITEVGSGTLIYNLTKKDKLNFSLTAIDYKSKGERVTYQLFISRMGVDHTFTETLSVDFSIGVSRQNATNLQTQSFDFFGQPITVSQSIDTENRGLVLDAGVVQLLENGKINGRISRNNTADSFGGLNQTDKFKVSYTSKVSALWMYETNARFNDITALGSTTRVRNRELLHFESIAYYFITRNWNINASYRYSQRKFKNDISNNRVLHSNRIYIGLTYNLSPISTF